jgi:hypothetical protein
MKKKKQNRGFGDLKKRKELKVEENGIGEGEGEGERSGGVWMERREKL